MSVSNLHRWMLAIGLLAILYGLSVI